MQPGAEKTERIANAEGIPLPKYYAELLQFYWKNMRPQFVTNFKTATAYFIGTNGRPLGKLLDLKLINYF